MKTILAFSGGKDSWACLWLYENELQNIDVVWVNTGKNFPELLETIEKAKMICPRFVEIKSDRDLQNHIAGIPSDIIPVDSTTEGQMFTGGSGTKVQSYLRCCYENIGHKITSYCIDNGVECVIRGQRSDETRKSPARDGDVVNGIKYVQPLDDWKEKDVFDFLSKKMQIPEHFRFKHTSMDCYDCTAYRKESKDKVDFMKKEYPNLYEIYEYRKIELEKAIKESMEA